MVSVDGKNFVDRNNSKWDNSVCKLMHRCKIGLKPKIFFYCYIPKFSFSLFPHSHVHTDAKLQKRFHSLSEHRCFQYSYER